MRWEAGGLGAGGGWATDRRTNRNADIIGRDVAIAIVEEWKGYCADEYPRVANGVQVGVGKMGKRITKAALSMHEC